MPRSSQILGMVVKRVSKSYGQEGRLRGTWGYCGTHVGGLQYRSGFSYERCVAMLTTRSG